MSIQPEVKLPGESEILAQPLTKLISADFVWTEEEKAKIARLARFLNVRSDVARQALVYFLFYVNNSQKSLPVAALPEVFAAFPIRWGYKKKRHDFLHLLQEMDFIYVRINYWAKVRAKKYGVGKAGLELLGRVVNDIVVHGRLAVG
jgi:hypothetical protein